MLPRPWLTGLLLLLTLAGGSLRMRAANNAGNALPLHSDAADFWQIGGALAQGDGYALDGRLTASRAPLVPTLAAAIRVAGGQPQDVRRLHALLGTLLIPIIFLLGRRLGPPEAALTAAGIAAFSTPQIAASASLGSEAPFTLLVCAAAWAAAGWAQKPGLGRAGLSGIFLGLTLLTRSTLLPLLPLLALSGAFFSPSPTRARHQVLVFLLSCAAILLPWTLRNGIQLRHWSPAETGNAGIVFYEGTVRVARSAALTEAEPAVTVMSVFPPAQRTRVFIRLGVENILAGPLGYLRMCTIRFAQLWTSSTPATVDDVYTRAGLPSRVLAVTKFLLLLGALAGCALGSKPQRTAGLFLLVYCLHVFISFHPRYALQISPVLFALGAAGWGALWLERRRAVIGIAAVLSFAGCGASPTAPELRSAPVLSQRASALVRADRSRAALPLFERALKKDPDLIEIYFNRAAAWVLLGVYPQAEADLNHFIGAASQDSPLRSVALRRRAALRVTRGDFAAARVDLQAALGGTLSPAERREITRALAILRRV
jgi:4-amino-4-deoxy-L-arabinose transferase-like glycosyltransferase